MAVLVVPYRVRALGTPDLCVSIAERTTVQCGRWEDMQRSGLDSLIASQHENTRPFQGSCGLYKRRYGFILVHPADILRSRSSRLLRGARV